MREMPKWRQRQLWRASHGQRYAQACQPRKEEKGKAASRPSASTSEQRIESKPFHEVLQHLEASTKLFRRIPKGVRILAETGLTEQKINGVVEKKPESA
ncbi:hypothetical protein RvY_02868 [Ramazzottius varieornatus]|uniref:Uncharacterized protein n=1 Tax=Ramazzottius varieornatus TaxID=947166 RepID=A0A1D1UL61_RAMVA|nr:hypothetical protein RvY_02868 [Ramazzottius varieornatus]